MFCVYIGNIKYINNKHFLLFLVKLGGEINKALTQGPVRFNYKGTWYPVCDTDFTDVTARRVCQDLGFLDGRALCCSAFDTSGLEYELVLAPSTLTQNISMQCQGGEETIAECVKVGGCKTEAYASVVCLTASQSVSSGMLMNILLGNAYRSTVTWGWGCLTICVECIIKLILVLSQS